MHVGQTIEITDLLPSWVSWAGPVGFVVVAALTVFLVPGMALRRTARQLRTPDTHWVRRAELATQGRTAILFGLLFWLLIAGPFLRMVDGPFAAVPAWLTLVSADALVVIATLYLGWRFVRGPLGQPTPPFAEHLWLLVRKYSPFVALLAVGLLAPSSLGSPWMIPWTLVAIAALFGTRYVAEWYVAIGVAEPGSLRVMEIVERAASSLSADTPKVVVVRSYAANALALPVRNLIIMTSRLVGMLDDAELEAVVHHEFAHLQEAGNVTRLRTWSMLTFVPLLAFRPLYRAGLPILIGVVLAMVVVHKLTRGVHQGEEQRADEEALERSHESAAFGAALLKLHQQALMPAFVRNDPHGPLHDRLTRAGITPDFDPITKATRLRTLVPGIVLAGLLILTAVVAPRFAVDIWDRETGSHTALAFGWHPESVLGWMGYSAADEGNFEEAAVFLEHAVALGNEGSRLDLVWAQAAMGQCKEAGQNRAELAALDNADSIDLEVADEWIVWCEAL